MSDDELAVLRDNAIRNDEIFTKSWLRKKFRMKPKPDAEPVKTYENRYGRRCALYKISECVPLKKNASRTTKQNEAIKKLIVWNKMNSSLGKAASAASALIDNDPVVLDTETTGLGIGAQVIEIALVDMAGNVLFNSRLNPSVPIEPEAFNVHGISEQSLINAPIWSDIYPTLQQVIGKRPLVIYNAKFDLRVMKQTAIAFNDDVTWLSELDTHCAMALAADFFGATNRHGSISLSSAAMAADVEWPGTAHAASTDAIVTAGVLQSIAGYYKNLQMKISNESLD